MMSWQQLDLLPWLLATSPLLIISIIFREEMIVKKINCFVKRQISNYALSCTVLTRLYDFDTVYCFINTSYQYVYLQLSGLRSVWMTVNIWISFVREFLQYSHQGQCFSAILIFPTALKHCPCFTFLIIPTFEEAWRMPKLHFRHLTVWLTKMFQFVLVYLVQ